MAEEQLGVHLVGAEIKRWHWVFRDQPVEDYGVDCEAEAPGADYPSGRLIGIQVKTGSAKYFKHKAPNGSGWWYSPGTRPKGEPDQHLRYWLENDRRIVLVLVDETTTPESMYWVHVTLDKVEFTGASWKILVPASQRLDATAQVAFRAIIAAPRSAEQADVLAAAVRELPPQAGRILHGLRDTNHFKALQLGVRLGRGRHDPASTCDKLLGTDRRYLVGADGMLHAALAAYAASHGCHGQAALAFTAAGAAGAPESSRYLALAAWSLIAAGDREQARDRLDEAEAAGAPAVLCAWIRAVIDFDGPGFPQLPRDVVDETRADPDGGPLYRIFLAHAALAGGDYAEAVRWFEEALAKEPDHSGLMIELARALLTREAANRSPLPGADHARALRLATAARDQRRRWAGPSEEAVLEMLHAAQMANDFPAALRAAAPAPIGEATAREAASAPVAFLGVRVALALGEADAAALIAAHAAPGTPHARAIALALDAQASATSFDEWLEILADAGDDAGLAVYALHRAAATGQWPIEPLEQQYAAGHVTAEGYEILRARGQAARGELDAATRTMRPLVSSSAVAAESFIEMLEDDGQLEEALAQCRRALERFPIAPLAAKQWNLLMRLGRTSEAVEQAVALLARPGFPPELRATLRGFLVGEANARRDWRAVEEHCRAAISEDPDRAPFPWMYIGAAYNRRSLNEAWERLTALAPPITSAQEAGLWVALHAYRGFSEQDVLDALDLIDRFPGERDLHGRIVTTLLTRGNKLAPDGRPILPAQAPAASDRFQAALDAFLAQGADGLRVVAMGSVQNTISAVRDGLVARAPLDDFLQTCLRSGAMPLVAACLATRNSYTTALLQRMYGPIVAVTQNPAEFEAELHDAAEALDGKVIVDASALAVACELPDRLPTLRGAFDEVAVDEETRFDCMTACSEVRQAPGSVSEIAVAGDGQTLRQIDTPDEDLATHATRANALEQLLATLDTFEPPNDQSAAREPDRPWLRTVHLAMDRQEALWCDDVALRREARALGCPTFGTVALLHAVAEAHDDDAELRDAVVQLVRAQVADIYLDPAELVALAEDHHGHPGPAAAALARPGYWIGSNFDSAATTVTGVLEMIQPRTPEDAADWFAAVCEGLASYIAPDQLEATLNQIAEAVARRSHSSEPEREALIRTAGQVAAAEQTRRSTMVSVLEGARTKASAPPDSQGTA